MEKKVTRVNYIGREGLVEVFGSFWPYVYTHSAVKDQNYNIGDAVVTPSGEEFIYAKAAAAITETGKAVHVTATAAVAGIEAFAAAAPINSTSVVINEASITENQLANGTMIFFAGGYEYTRGIVGNTASGAGNLVTVFLDGPTMTAISTSDQFEAYASPYASVSQAVTSGELTFLGSPASIASSGDYFWIKATGRIFIDPQNNVGDALLRTGYFRHDGSIDVRALAGTFHDAFVTDQVAGFVVVGSKSGDGPLFKLTVGRM